MAAAAKPIQTSPSFTPPVAMPAPKDQNTMRIAMIALPLIAAVAAFALLSLESAILMTAVITVGAIGYFYGQKTLSPANPSVIPDQQPQPSSTDAQPEAVSTPVNPKVKTKASKSSSILNQKTPSLAKPTIIPDQQLKPSRRPTPFIVMRRSAGEFTVVRPIQAKVYDNADIDGQFALFIFKSEEDATSFRATFCERYPTLVTCRDIGDDKGDIAFYYKENVGAEMKAQITSELRTFIP